MLPNEVWNDIISFLSVSKCCDLVYVSRRITYHLSNRIAIALNEVEDREPFYKLQFIENADFINCAAIIERLVSSFTEEEAISILAHRNCFLLSLDTRKFIVMTLLKKKFIWEIATH
uniref:F-box domain-containing protein n=1 Tax=Ditylenchus dipsaci TaxID=166011 RepID=A0A915DG53_9BILA